jgi:ribosomal protein S12 methylthiotransferase accessory factor
MLAETAAPALSFGPAVDAETRSWLLTSLAGLPGSRPTAVNAGWSLAWEHAAWQRSESELLSIRLFADEVQAGPLWSAGAGAGCSGCAERRARLVRGHPLADQLDQPVAGPRPGSPGQPEWLGIAVAEIAARPLAPGELVAVGGNGAGRHQIHRVPRCPVCGTPAPDPRRRPRAVAFPSPPVLPDDPLRAAPAQLPLDAAAMRRRLVNPRFGPVVQVRPETRAPFAMSGAVLPGAPALGYGRSLTFGNAEPVAVLEAYERLGGFPQPGLILPGVPYREVAGQALDPATLGGYTPEQFARPTCRVIPSDEATPLDWAWGHRLGSGEPVLVPAEIAFFRYLHGVPGGAGRGPRHFEDCSSGCALGGSLTEAVLHALLELHERDAFLLAWHRAAPLPRIDPASLGDALSRKLLGIIAARGFETHLLVTTADIDLPAVWALAVDPRGGYPASYSAAGAGVEPAKAVRSALWELAQLVCEPPWWDRARIEPMLDDPWLVDELDDHIALYTLPEMLPRVTTVLGGRLGSLDEAFPGWPECFTSAAGGGLRGALDQVRERFRAAGLDQIAVVDQSTEEHLDLGLRVVKAVVPGIVPMCFGQAEQRLLGLDRLARVIPAGRAGTIPYDPHPFP